MKKKNKYDKHTKNNVMRVSNMNMYVLCVCFDVCVRVRVYVHGAQELLGE